MCCAVREGGVCTAPKGRDELDQTVGCAAFIKRRGDGPIVRPRRTAKEVGWARRRFMVGVRSDGGR